MSEWASQLAGSKKARKSRRLADIERHTNPVRADKKPAAKKSAAAGAKKSRAKASDG